MKKFISILMITVLALCLSGCAQDEGAGAGTTAAAGQSTESAAAETEAPARSSVEIKDGGTVYVTTRGDGSVASGGEDLPLAVRITYELDGAAVPADEIAGRSGHLVMRLDYDNLTSHTARIGEEDVTVCAPMTAITMLLLDEETFSNVTSEDGELMTVSDQTFFMGTAMPGLRESLRLDGWEETADIDIPESVTLEADVTDFQLDFALTMVQMMDLSELADEDLDSLSDISEGMDDLEEAGAELQDGTAELADGVHELRDGVKTYVNSVGKLSDGIASARDGAGQLHDAGSALSDGAAALRDNGPALTEGAQAVSDGLTALQALLGSYTPDPASEDPRDQLLLAAKAAADQLSEGAAGLSSGVSGYVSGAGALADGLGSYISGADSLYEGLRTLADGASALKDAGSDVKSGLKALAEGTDELADGVNEFYEEGIKELTEKAGDGYDDVIRGLRAMKQASAAYAYPGVDGEVRFVYETEY